MELGIILDVIIIAIIAISVIVSAKFGFVRTVIEVVGFICVFYLAFSVSKPIANYIYEKSVEPSIVSSAEESIGKTYENATEAIWNAFPDFITNNAEKYGLHKNDFSKSISETTSNNITDIAKSASRSVAMPVITKIISLAVSFLLIIILMFFVKMLAKVINKMFSFSILGVFNSILGGILGLLKGLIFCIGFCLLVSLIISINKNGLWFITKENIASSHIFKFLFEAIPFIKI